MFGLFYCRRSWFNAIVSRTVVGAGFRDEDGDQLRLTETRVEIPCFCIVTP